MDGPPPMPPTYPPEMAQGSKRRKEKDMFAVVKSGGRQYKVAVGQKFEVNRLPVEVGAQVALDVLLISDADNTRLGSPFIDNAQVLATVDGQTRGEKLIVFKYKSKKRYRHRRGHRQELTALIIDDIVAAGKSLVTGEAPVVRQVPAEEEIEATPVESNVEEVTPTDTGTTRTRRRRSSVEETESSTEE